MTGVLSVSPAPGSVETASVSSIDVTFDTPIANDSIGFGDFDLDLVNPDGSLTSALDPVNAPAESQPTPNGPVVSVDLSTTTLAPGTYEVFLDAATGLATFDADTQADGDFIAPADGNNLLLSEFTIATPGVGLNDAVGPYTVGPNVTSLPGSLDLADNPSQVDLYRITVPAGPMQSLGIEVDADPGTDALSSAVTLFDQDGNPIATNDQGLAASPHDAYLFEGVSPGTYYIGVSGAGNLPGVSGGYNIQDATAGTVAQAQPGGGYTLNVVCDPAGAPTTVTGFRLDHADPLDSTPSGFTLQFSGPVQLGVAADGSNVNPASQLEVVDASGQAWDLATGAYEGGPTQVTYLLSENLPEGSYSIVMPDHDGLLDFADRAVSATGLPDGVLATFTVQSNATMPGDDLGWIPPGKGQVVSAAQALDPGTAAIYRFTIATPGYYQFGEVSAATSVSISIGRDGPGDPVAVSRFNPLTGSVLAYLDPGSYRVFVVNDGATTAQVQTTIQLNGGLGDSLASSGLGQTTALNLRLATPGGSINPTPPATPGSSSSPSAPAPPVTALPTNSSPSAPQTPAPPSAPSNGGSTGSTGGGNAAPASNGHVYGPVVESPGSAAVADPHEGGPSGGSGNAFSPLANSAAASASNQAGLFLAIGGNPVGRPNPDADHVGAIGISGEGGAIALAAAGPGLGQAISAGIGRGYQPDLADRAANPGSPAEPDALADGSITKAGTDAMTLALADAGSPPSSASIPSPINERSDAPAVAVTENPEPNPGEASEGPAVASNLNDESEWNGLASANLITPVQVGIALALAWGAHRVFVRMNHPRPTIVASIRRTLPLTTPSRAAF